MDVTGDGVVGVQDIAQIILTWGGSGAADITGDGVVDLQDLTAVVLGAREVVDVTDDEEQLLDDLIDLESGLSPWEIDFVENLDRHWRDRDLTEKQSDTLRDIGRSLL